MESLTGEHGEVFGAIHGESRRSGEHSGSHGVHRRYSHGIRLHYILTEIGSSY